MLLGMQNSVREWTITFPSEFPFWELESQWTSKFSEDNCKGQNSLDWDVPYIIEKLCERKCLKWVRMTHLDTWNTSYGQKKGQKSNWQFDSQPLKIKNHPNFLAYKWYATYHWKDLNGGYNFILDFIAIEGLQTRLWAPKLSGVLILGISTLPLWSPGTKCHLDAGPVTRHIVYYKGEGGGFSQVRAMMSLVSLRLPMVFPNTKSVLAMH
jgi:hypothetical protein